MQKQGILRSWNDEKGFGFITDKTGGPDTFIHISAFKDRNFRPQVNQTISYTPKKDKDGRPRASLAFVKGAKNTSSKRNPQSNRRLKLKGKILVAISLCFMLAISVLALVNKLPIFVLYLYCILSIIAFAFYKTDKFAAQQGHWRTPEKVLFVLSLLGGWPGGLISQQLIAHKSSKLSFRIKHSLMIILNLLMFAWLFTEQGSSIMWFVDETISHLIGEVINLSSG